MLVKEGRDDGRIKWEIVDMEEGSQDGRIAASVIPSLQSPNASQAWARRGACNPSKKLMSQQVGHFFESFLEKENP